MTQTRAEEEAQKLRSKIQSLQVDLDNSEAVQRDFVKLSQSLQVPSCVCQFWFMPKLNSVDVKLG